MAKAGLGKPAGEYLIAFTIQPGGGAERMLGKALGMALAPWMP
jgi:hypothetical protein